MTVASSRYLYQMMELMAIKLETGMFLVFMLVAEYYLFEKGQNGCMCIWRYRRKKKVCLSRWMMTEYQMQSWKCIWIGEKTKQNNNNKTTPPHTPRKKERKKERQTKNNHECSISDEVNLQLLFVGVFLPAWMWPRVRQFTLFVSTRPLEMHVTAMMLSGIHSFFPPTLDLRSRIHSPVRLEALLKYYVFLNKFKTFLFWQHFYPNWSCISFPHCLTISSL